MPPIIDAHLHVWRALPPDAPGAATIVSAHEDVPVERALNVFDQHGVDRGVLVQPVYPGEDNSYVADCAAAHPDRLAAVCVVDPRTPGAADRLGYWVNERGCRGLRLRPRIPAESACFGDPATFPLWERARSLGIAINVLASPEHLSAVDALADRFSEVPILIDHLAHPNVAEGTGGPGFQTLLSLSRHPRVSVKVSGYYYFSSEADPYADCWDLVRAVHDRFGPDRLIWGSDFPHVERKTGYARSLDFVRQNLTLLSESDRARILGGNALALYWSGETTTA
jgi:predicted TIM-barrel fold metal-dependent hydrolase